MDKVTQSKDAYEPLRILKNIVHYPHDNNTWISFGHTVNIGERPLFDNNFVAISLVAPELLKEEGCVLDMPDGIQVWFLALIFLLEDEWDFCMQNSTNELIELARSKGRIDDLLILTPGRSSILNPSSS